MIWDTPEVEEIKMDAEIGSYQLDDEERGAHPRSRASEPPPRRRAMLAMQ
jgi:hypothetical protein